MAYTTIDKPTDYFNTILYTGNGTAIGSGGNSITGLNFQPDWVWIKNRSGTTVHHLQDAVRGSTKALYSNLTNAEGTSTENVNSFDSDGFTVGSGTGVNTSGNNFVSWNWLAGGTAPAITYTVKVVSDSGNKYRFDDFGTSAVTLDLQEGGTYTFDQSDSSNSGHPLRFSTTSNGTHGGGSEYTTGVTTTGTPGSAGAKTVITVAASAPTLYYYCTQHSGMGGQANTNSTHGSSNFGGSIQANVSASTTAGFSIVSYTSNASGQDTVGHGLGVTPNVIITKSRDGGTFNWSVFHSSVCDTTSKFLILDGTAALSTFSTVWGASLPTSSVFGITSGVGVEASDNCIAYCFAEKKGYSKFGSYTGNGNADGTFVYTGMRPAFCIIKRTDSAGYSWATYDSTRYPENKSTIPALWSNLSDAEGSYSTVDFLSNGFKIRDTSATINASGGTYIYMAFAENPFVTSTGIPTTAR